MRRRLGQAKRRPNTKQYRRPRVGSSLTLDPTYLIEDWVEGTPLLLARSGTGALIGADRAQHLLGRASQRNGGLAVGSRYLERAQAYTDLLGADAQEAA